MPKRSSVELTKRLVDAASSGQWLWDGGTRGVSGFGLRVAPGGMKAFIFRYRTGEGRQRIVKLGGYPALTVEQCRELAKKRAHEVAEGGDPVAAKRALKSAPTVQALADYYLGPYAASKPLRASTVQAAQGVLRQVLPDLGRMKVGEVTADDIRRARTKVSNCGRDAANALAIERGEILARTQKALEEATQAVTEAERSGRRAGTLKLMLTARAREVTQARGLADRAVILARAGRAGVHQANRLHAVLGAMFNLAIEQGTRLDNPCRPLKKLHEDERWRHLSDSEVGRLLDACDVYEAENDFGSDARGATDAVRLLLFTGARLREVLGAEWSQFDLEKGLWEKPSAHTKTKRQHRVELEGPALDLLRAMLLRAAHSRFLFPGDPNKSPKGRKTGGAIPIATKPRADLKRPWVRLVRLAGLEDVRLHDLRRTTASFMLSGGASLASVGKSLGHTQARTTSRYAHLSETVQRKDLREAGERMAALRGINPKSNVSSISLKMPA